MYSEFRPWSSGRCDLHVAQRAPFVTVPQGGESAWQGPDAITLWPWSDSICRLPQATWGARTDTDCGYSVEMSRKFVQVS
jgi:hypothetical protein